MMKMYPENICVWEIFFFFLDKEVVSVSGSVGQIPCPVTSFDDVVMILWFKGASGAPIYR